MVISVGSNIASLQAQRRLGEASTSLGKVYERLSSGQRINRASDDAAGLAIAETLNAKSRIYSQGIKNLNDGFSALAIADSAVENVAEITIRLKELAEQSANGVYSSGQRHAMDDEAQALSKEFLRIVKTTQFNGIGLLDGSTQGSLTLQAGLGAEGTLTVGIGGAIGNGTFTASTSLQTGGSPSSITTGDLNGDGVLDFVTADSSSASIFIGRGDGTYLARTTLQITTSLSVADLDGDGVLDIVSAGSGIFFGKGDGTFSARATVTAISSSAITTGDLNGDGQLDLISVSQATNLLSIFMGSGNGTFATSTTLQTGLGPSSIAAKDLNGDGVLDLISADIGASTASIFLGRGDGTFNARTTVRTWGQSFFATTADFNSDGVLDLISADVSTSTASIFIGKGDGTFFARTTVQTGSAPRQISIGDFNGDGVPDFISADNGATSASILLGRGDGSFSTRSTVTTGVASASITTGDLNGDGVLDLIAGDALGNASILIGQTIAGTAPLISFSLRTKADALQAMGIFDDKLDALTAQRGVLGSLQSRISVASGTLLSATENFKAAESRIRDADIASDSANLTRTKILQQAAAAVLSQANQQPSLSIRLLQGL